jgi:hypothetical protein
MVGDAVSFAGSTLSRSATALMPGAKEGENLSTYLSRQLVELVTQTGIQLGILSNTAASAAAGVAGAGTSALGAAGSAGSGISALAGLGKVASWVGGLFAAPETGGASLALAAAANTAAGVPGFRYGGIVPSAAGGWALPNFSGMRPAMLHGGEMVLPQDLRAKIEGLPSGGGGGDAHLHFHGPADAAGIDRWFKGLLSRNPGAISDLFRSNRLTPRTL